MEIFKDIAVNFESPGIWFGENAEGFRMYVHQNIKTFILHIPDEPRPYINTLDFLAHVPDEFEYYSTGLHKWMVKVANIDENGEFLPWPKLYEYIDIDGLQVEVAANPRTGELRVTTDSYMIVSFISELCTHNDELNHLERGQLLVRMYEILDETDCADNIASPQDRREYLELPHEFHGFNRIKLNDNIYLLMLVPETDNAVLVVPRMTFTGSVTVFEKLYPEISSMKKGKLIKEIRDKVSFMGMWM